MTTIIRGTTPGERARLERPRIVFWTDATADDEGEIHLPEGLGRT